MSVNKSDTPRHEGGRIPCAPSTRRLPRCAARCNTLLCRPRVRRPSLPPSEHSLRHRPLLAHRSSLAHTAQPSACIPLRTCSLRTNRSGEPRPLTARACSHGVRTCAPRRFWFFFFMPPSKRKQAQQGNASQRLWVKAARERGALALALVALALALALALACACPRPRRRSPSRPRPLAHALAHTHVLRSCIADAAAEEAAAAGAHCNTLCSFSNTSMIARRTQHQCRRLWTLWSALQPAKSSVITDGSSLTSRVMCTAQRGDCGRARKISSG